jgi:hypothetical protein
MKLEFYRQIYGKKSSNIKFNPNHSSMHMDGGTDIMKLTVAFHNVATAPKNGTCGHEFCYFLSSMKSGSIEHVVNEVINPTHKVYCSSPTLGMIYGRVALQHNEICYPGFNWSKIKGHILEAHLKHQVPFIRHIHKIVKSMCQLHQLSVCVEQLGSHQMDFHEI